MHKIRSRGFTLIELLVVIAIIGILSAVVLASLNTARGKGQDAAVQSDLDGIRTEAEIYYGGKGANSYGAAGGNTCTFAGSLFDSAQDATIARQITAAENANGSPSLVCGSNASAYAVESQLPSTIGGTAAYWCVDSTGVSAQKTTALVAGATACPAT